MYYKRTYWFIIILISGLLFHYNTWGDINSARKQSDEKIRHLKGDFDKDGIKDLVTITESFGSSTYFLDVIINDGKKSHTYSQEFSSGQFLNPVYIDKKLFARYKSLFMDSVFRYPEKKADPSLQWLMDANCSKKILTNNYFDLSIKYTPLWNTKMEWPSSYKILNEQTNSCMNKDSVALYVYTADNHYTQEKLLSKSKTIYTIVPKNDSSEITLLKTPHAIIALNKNEYSWVFISDENITESGEKLRWPSIDTATCQGDLIFILQKSPEKRLFIVDYKKGCCFRLNKKLYNNEAIGSIALRKENLYVKTTDSEHVVSMDRLMKEMEIRSFK